MVVIYNRRSLVVIQKNIEGQENEQVAIHKARRLTNHENWNLTPVALFTNLILILSRKSQ